MATVVKSMATSGVDGFMVEIEASTIRGQQQMMSIIGLPDQAVKEAGERIQAAIESCGYDIPKDKVIISLAPGDRKKRGSHFDLGMIIALLFQTDQISPRNLAEYAFIGELSLDGRVRPCMGKQSAIMLTCDEVKNGSAIISGMAKGIDSYAHTAALKNEGYTIAVLGNGVDICYPEEHERLYEEIARKGCVLSEYPPGTNPREFQFPRRNRLITALADELFVIDAGRHSGTETTVKFCEIYGRTVG